MPGFVRGQARRAAKPLSAPWAEENVGEPAAALLAAFDGQHRGPRGWNQSQLMKFYFAIITCKHRADMLAGSCRDEKEM